MATSQNGKEFTDEERAAMKARAAENRERAKRSGPEGDALNLADCLEAIAKLPAGDREVAERLHVVITQAEPRLAPRTWYGMPAYAIDGNTMCFFQTVIKYKSRYHVLGFTDKANLDDGLMWATSFAVAELTPAVEQQIADLVRRATSN